MCKILALSIFIISLALPVYAGPSKYQKKGYVQNEQGEKCWYTQKTDTNNTYFHGMQNTVGIITFDNPQCMSGKGVAMDTNKMMINILISQWYSHSDAKFRTRTTELFKSSALQKKGQCIQSQTYPAIGITVDYFIKDDSITGAIHGQSIQGCKN